MSATFSKESRSDRINVPKLVGKANYREWSIKSRLNLEGSDCMKVIDSERGPPKLPKIVDPPIHVDELDEEYPHLVENMSQEEKRNFLENVEKEARRYHEWKAKDSEARRAIVATISDDIAFSTQDKDSAKSLWNALKVRYGKAGVQEFVEEMNALTNLKPENAKSAGEWIAKANVICTRIRDNLGDMDTEKFLCYLLLTAFGQEYTAVLNSFFQKSSLDSSEAIAEAIVSHDMQLRATRVQKPTATPTSTTKYQPKINVLKRKNEGGDKKEEKKPRIQCKECLKKHRIKEGNVCWYAHPNEAPEWWKKQVDSSSSVANQKTSNYSVSLPSDVLLQAQEIPTNTWLIDTGATHHFCANRSWFTSVKLFSARIASATGETEAQGQGEITMKIGNLKIVLKDVVYVPNLKVNTICPERLKKDNCVGYTNWQQNRLFDGKTGLTLTNLDVLNGIPSLRISQEESLLRVHYFETQDKAVSMSLAHRRLGHISPQKVKLLAEGMAEGLTLKTTKLPEICDNCMMGQMKAKPFPNQSTNVRSQKPFEMIHMDLLEAPMPALGTGFTHLFTITDDWTRMLWSYGLKSKDVLQDWRKWKTYINNQYSDQHEIRIKRIRADNGGEFISKEIQSEFEAEGIELQLTVAHAHNQNGVAERAFQDIVRHAISILHDAKLPTSLWYEICLTITYLKSLWPHAHLGNKTPYECIHNRKPDLSHLRVIGSKAWVLIPKPSRAHKFDPRAVICRLLGYEGSNQYRLWSPEQNKIIWARDVSIDELNDKLQSEDKVPNGHFDDCEDASYYLPLGKAAEVVEAEETEETARSQAASEEGEKAESQAAPIKTADINDFIDAYHGDEIATEKLAAKHQQQKPSERQAQRVRKPSQKVKDNQIPVSELEMPEVHTLSMMEEPKTYQQAMEQPQIWVPSMEEEINAHKKNNTWTLVGKPKNAHVLSGKWVYINKTNAEGEVIRHKSRWVVKGFEQIYRIDYDETFSPVTKITALRLILAIVAFLGLHIHQMDFVTAFLNGEIKEDIYVVQPTGFERGDWVCKLNRALYGLKQAPRSWFTTLKNFLQKLGFSQFNADISIFSRGDIFTGVIIIVYVDDILIISRDLHQIAEIKEKLSKAYKMKDLGEVSYYLGLQIKRNENVSLSQETYMTKILKRNGMDSSNAVTTPMITGFKAEMDWNEDLQKSYQKAMGELIYASTHTRIDIAYVVGYLSRFNHRPTKCHMQAVKRVYRYLNGTKSSHILYKKNEGDLDKNLLKQIVGYTDSDWGGDEETRRSTSGYVFLFNGAPFSWKSKRQPTVTLSSCEAEYVGQCQATREAAWIRILLSDLGVDCTRPIKIFTDNQGALALSKNPEHHARSKHIDIQWHYVREEVEKNKIDLQYISTEKMIADVLTKALPGPKFNEFKQVLLAT